MPQRLQKGLAYLFTATAVVLGILGGLVYHGENLVVIGLAVLSLCVAVGLSYRFYPDSSELDPH